MSRLFNGSSDVLLNVAASITAIPLTISCWFYPTDVTSVHTLVALDDNSQNNRFALQANGSTGGDPVQASVTAAGSGASASTSTSFVANTWQHAAAVFTSATSRAVYLNGGGVGTNATNLTPTGIARTRVGLNSTPANGTVGRIAEVCIIAEALTAAEVAALAHGTHPMYIRAVSILGYWPLWGAGSPEPDYTRGQKPLTVTGATVAPHPAVQPYGMGMDFEKAVADAGPTTVKLYTGSEWVDREIKVFDGATWG